MPRGVEQEPQRKPLDELRSRLDRFNHASFKVDSMIKDPGGEPWPQRLNLNGIAESEHYLETAVRVGEITERLKIKTQPILEQKRYAVYSEIEDRISEAEENVGRITEFAEQGLYGARSEEILEKAQRALRELKGEYPQPDEAFLRQVEQYVKDHLAPYTMKDLEHATGRSTNSGLSKIKFLDEVAESLGIDFKRGRGKRNRFNAEDLRQLAIKIGPPNPLMSEAAKKGQGERQEIAAEKPEAITEEDEDRQGLLERIRAYIAVNTKYYYSTKDVYRVTGRSEGSLKSKQLEEIIRRHGIVIGEKKTHKFRFRTDEFMEIALDIGFPRVSQTHASRTQGHQRRESGQSLDGGDQGPKDPGPAVCSDIGESYNGNPAAIVEIDSSGGVDQGAEEDDDPQADWESPVDRIKALEREKAIAALRIELPRVILGHFAEAVRLHTDFPFAMGRDVLKISLNNLPSDTDLKDVFGDISPEEMRECFLGLFEEGTKEYWDTTADELEGKGRVVSVKEKQIINFCQALKRRYGNISYFFKEVRSHFSTQVTGQIPARNRGPQTTVYRPYGAVNPPIQSRGR